MKDFASQPQKPLNLLWGRGLRAAARFMLSLAVILRPGSIEGYDRGGQVAAYRQLPSLDEYVLIDSRAAEVFRRHPEGWVLQPVPEDGRLGIDSLGFDCGMDAIYEDVDFTRSAVGGSGD